MKTRYVAFSLAGLVFVCAAALGQVPSGSEIRQMPDSPAVIRVGTRLVEVEVVVRDKDGPVRGLTQDDFTLLDEGKKQKIAVFSAPDSSGSPNGSGSARQPVTPLPAGTVSNRLSRSGAPVAGATVLLYDQLNTSLDNQSYARTEILKYLDSAPTGEQIAIYLLGKELSVVQDFTDNLEARRQAVRKFGANPLSMLIQNTEDMDAIDRGMYDDHPEMRRQITVQAMAKIAQHLSGMPGRRSLVWLSDKPGQFGTQFLGPANIHLYPVLARGVGTSGVAGWLRDKRELGFNTSEATALAIGGGTEIERGHANAALAAAYGSAGFTDSRDLSIAVHTAVEDAGNTYLLGFYPSESAMDNKFHLLNVNVGKKKAAGRKTPLGKAIEVRYRPGYLATHATLRAPAPASIEDVLRNPLNETAIGIAAAPGIVDGKYQVAITVDLHDINFSTQDNRHVATVVLSFADDASHVIETGTVKLGYTDAEFTQALRLGLGVSKTFVKPSMQRFVVQDAATKAAGSLWIAPPEEGK